MRKMTLIFLLIIVGTGFVFSSTAHCSRDEWENLSVFKFSDPRRNLVETLKELEYQEKLHRKDSVQLCSYIEDVGREYKSLQEFAKAVQCFERSLRIQSKNDTAYMKIDDTRLKLSNLYFYMGFYQKAEELVLKVLDNQVETLGERSREVASTKNRIAVLYRWQGRFKEARDLYQQAISVFEALKDPNLPHCLKDYAFLHVHEGKYEEAEVLLKQALKDLEHIEKVQDKPCFHVPVFMSYLADTLAVQGRFEEAEKIYSSCLDIIQERYGKGNFNEKIFHFMLAKFYRNWDHPMEAERHYRYVASIFFIMGIIPDMTVFLEEIAAFYREECRFDEAEIVLLKAKEGVELVYGKDHPFYASVLNKLGVLYREWGRMFYLEGKYELSEKYLKESMERTAKIVSEIHPSRICLLHELGVLYHYQERFDEGEKLYRKAIDNYTEGFGPRFFMLRQVLHDMALLCQTTGKLEEAGEFNERSESIPDIAKWLE